MNGAFGVDRVVKRHYLTSDIQICTIHTMRKEEIIPQIKDLFLLNDLNLIKAQANNICSLYQKYKRQISAILKKEYLFTYLNYPNVIYKTTKSTNRIEAIN